MTKNDILTEALEHSWGKKPEQKAKEKAYNAKYYQEHKDKWLTKYSKNKGSSTKLHGADLWKNKLSPSAQKRASSQKKSNYSNVQNELAQRHPINKSDRLLGTVLITNVIRRRMLKELSVVLQMRLEMLARKRSALTVLSIRLRTWLLVLRIFLSKGVPFMMPFNFDPNNVLFQQMFGNFNNFQNQFQSFAQQFSGGAGMNAQQIIQQKLDSGEMSQEQFNYLRQLANQMTGMNK